MGVPLRVKNLRVTSLDLDFHRLTWEVEPTTQDVLDYTFQVLRAEAPMGPFDPLTDALVDRYTFVDTLVQQRHRWRQYFYKLRVARRATGEYSDTDAVSHEPRPDLLAMELRRHMRLLFHEFAGRRCVVLPVRTFGQRCPQCWDSVLEKRVRSGCQTCYDTGFARGYMHPIESWIQMDPSQKSQQNLSVGATQQSNSTLRMGYFPPVKPYDLVVEPENRRWRVVSQTQTEHSRAGVHQEVQVHEVPAGDIEFAIPVDFGAALENMYFTPGRNYTNPHNFQNFEDEEIPNIYALYASSYPDHR